MTPPRALVKALRRYDAKLRVRFGVHSHKWVIERKVPEAMPEVRQALGTRCPDIPTIKDRVDGAREGYVDVLWIHHEDINHEQRILAALHASDSHAQGGFEALNAAWDAEEQRQALAVDRARADFCETRAKAAYDSIQMLEKRRIDVPVEIRDGFVVHDRRQVTV